MKFKFIVLLLFFFINNITYAQINTKELISKDNEVDLPMDITKKNIYFSYSIDEETFSKNDLKNIIPPIVHKYFDTNTYFKISTDTNILEYFVIYPCVLIDSQKLIDHKLKQNGYITSNMIVRLKKNEYTLEFSDFDWYDIQKNKRNLSKMYTNYKNSNNLRERVINFGVLKSAEQLIANSLENYVLVVDEIIDKKIPPQKPELPETIQSAIKEENIAIPKKESIEFVTPNSIENLEEFRKEAFDYFFK